MWAWDGNQVVSLGASVPSRPLRILGCTALRKRRGTSHLSSDNRDRSTPHHGHDSDLEIDATLRSWGTPSEGHSVLLVLLTTVGQLMEPSKPIPNSKRRSRPRQPLMTVVLSQPDRASPATSVSQRFWKPSFVICKKISFVKLLLGGFVNNQILSMNIITNPLVRVSSSSG